MFVVFKDKHPRSVETRQLPKLRKLLGDDLWTAFVQAFNSAERLDAVVSFFTLTSAHLKRGSVGRDRNLRALAMWQYGELYEALKVIERLSRVARIVGDDFPPWRGLKDMLGRWKRDDLLKRMRTEMGFHPADKALVLRGTDRIGHGEALTLYESDDGSRTHSAFPFAFEVQLQGLGLPRGALHAFIERAARDFEAFGRRVQALFCETLRCNGVQFSRWHEVAGPHDPDTQLIPGA